MGKPYLLWYWREALDEREDLLSTWGFIWTSGLEVFGLCFSFLLFIVLVWDIMGNVTQVYTVWKEYMHHQEYKIVTLYVNGLQNPIKRSKITLHLTKNTLWRLKMSILNDKTVQKQIQQEFETYLQNNDNREVSPNTLWDAAKAVVRGKIIAITAFRKKREDLLNFKRKWSH